MHFCSFTVSRLSLRIWHVWICNHRNCQRSRVLGHWTRLLLLFPEVGTPATCVPCATQRFVHIGWLFFRKRNCSYVCLNGGGHAQLGFQWKRWPSYTQKSLKRVLRIPGWYEATEREREKRNLPPWVLQIRGQNAGAVHSPDGDSAHRAPWCPWPLWWTSQCLELGKRKGWLRGCIFWLGRSWQQRK